MKLITEKDIIRDVAKVWHKQYSKYIDSGEDINVANFDMSHQKPSKQIYEELLNLDPNAAAADIASIIGNDSWTKIFCDVCGEISECKTAVQFHVNYEDVVMCRKCIIKALNIILQSE